jgi:hypothetical protein
LLGWHCFVNFLLYLGVIFISFFVATGFGTKQSRLLVSFATSAQGSRFGAECVTKNGAKFTSIPRATVKLNPLNYHPLDVILVWFCSLAATF